MSADVREQLALRVVGRLLGLQYVAVGYVHVEPGEVAHGDAPVGRIEELAVQIGLLAILRSIESLRIALCPEDVDVSLFAVEALGRPLRQAVGDVVRHLAARREATAQQRGRRVARHLGRCVAGAHEAVVYAIQRPHAVFGGVVGAVRGNVDVAAAEKHVRVGVVARQRDVLAAALRDDRALDALLLARHESVVEVVLGAERVLV